MSPIVLFSVVLTYFAMLILVSYFTSRGQANNATFFKANKQSPWYLVAFGMIGASLSGVTFISIPGTVSSNSFGYMQVVLGYFFGYLAIAFVLMPIYYKLNVTTIYTYLQKRFGLWTYKTGAFFFLISRLCGSAIRLLLVANVLQFFVFDDWGVPFEITVLISLLLIWVYTFRGGIKTIVWTDTLQTFTMLLAVGFTIGMIMQNLNWSFADMTKYVSDSSMSRWFFFDDWKAENYFWKDFLGGFFTALAMTGLDQDMMQKNLTCKNVKEAQKNMVTFSTVLIGVNLMFLALGALLYLYAEQQAFSLPLDEKGKLISDQVYPTLALSGELGWYTGLLFIIGLIAAAYSSADSALTALTTSVCYDILNIEQKINQEKLRKRVHVAVTVLLYLVILLFHKLLDRNAISMVLFVAGLTYGPLIGLFAFGILTKRSLYDKWVPLVAVLSPVLSYLTHYLANEYYQFSFGWILIGLNGFIMFGLLWLISRK
ncbi:MAG: sodium:solute symporter [Flavobacteriales bacterium]